MSLNTEQVWKIGDCLDVMQEYPDNYFDLVVTDLPYNIDYKTNHRISKNKKNGLNRPKIEHSFTSPIHHDKNNNELIRSFIGESHRILKNDAAFYCFCSPDTIELFKNEIAKKYKIKNIIIWVKNNWTAGDLGAQFGKQYEMIVYANKGRKIFSGKRLTDVWMFDRVSPNVSIHQNQKPLKLIEQIINISSNEGDMLLDPFCGSGTILEASLNTNRNCIGIDISDEWVPHYRKRLKSDNSKLTDNWRG